MLVFYSDNLIKENHDLKYIHSFHKGVVYFNMCSDLLNLGMVLKTAFSEFCNIYRKMSAREFTEGNYIM